MTAALTIPNLPADHPSQDYEWLRQAGLRYLEKVARQWTDYNTHDPGITILEVLCYAITDLGYRTDFPVEELLADGKPDSLKRHFLTAPRALPSAPVTELDFRKILLDIPGVKNAWLQENLKHQFKVDCTASKITRDPIPSHHKQQTITLRGIYDILVQEDETITEEPSKSKKKKKQEVLRAAVRRVFNASRNIGEELDEIRTVPMQDIRVCGDIELHPEAVIERVYAEVLYRLQLHFNPPVPRRTLAELLERDIPVESIFEGPLLNMGFIDDNELRRSGLKTEIRLSDLIRVIMDIPGVKFIRKIHFNYCNSTNPDAPLDEDAQWVLPVKPGHLPNLCEENSRFKFFKGLLPFEIDQEKIDAEYAAIVTAEQAKILTIAQASKDLPLPEPRFLPVAEYTSIQHDLPRAYGVGKHGVPDVVASEREHRQAQARQLRAYLLLFDQLMADYLAQLSQIRALFEADASLGQTYFHQVVGDLPDVETAYGHYDQLENLLVRASGEHEPSADGISLFEKRKNRLMDHLLARFCESFNEYVLLQRSLSGRGRTDANMLPEKMAFLREYEWLSRNRAQALDYYNEVLVDSTGEPQLDGQGDPIAQPLWYDQTNAPPHPALANISGIEHRVARLTGIPNILRRNLSSIFYGLYEQLDDDTETDMRFRVVDTDREKILLSSSRRYDSRAEMLEELRIAIRLAVIEENYQLATTTDGRFYFNIIDRTDDNVVARRIEYFETEAERAEAIRYLIQFLNDNYSEEGFFLVEHLLLRPRTNSDNFLPVCTEPDCVDCGTPDPYSHRVQVILPGYTPRFSDMDFRRFFEDTLRRELPAHLIPRICWIGIQQMQEFEQRYKNWLEAFRAAANGAPLDGQEQALNDLIAILNELYTIYPEGTLHDCDDAVSEFNPIILGQTHIGTLPPDMNQP